MNLNNVIVFDYQTVENNRQRANNIKTDHRFLFKHCQESLEDRLHDIKHDFSSRVDLKKSLTNLADDVPFSLQKLDHDLIISHLNLHWINDLPGRLFQIRQHLKPDGVFLASMFGGETLYELRQSLMVVELEMFGGVSPRVSPMVDMRDMGALLQRAGFNLPVVDHDVVRVTYDHIFSLIADLRGMGQNNAILNRSTRHMGREFWARVNDHYQTNFANEKGRLIATFEVIYLIGWAPDESQQKPLKPGTAKISLAQVLKTQEIKLPEKAKS